MNRTLKNNYRELETSFAITDIDSAVKELKRYDDLGEKVYYVFNGTTLFSDTVNLDDAYKQITGYTKAEFEERQRKFLKEYKEEQQREKQAAKAKIPEWIERGKVLIYPEQLESWKECVEIRANDLYNGKELEAALEIMEIISNDNSLEKAKETLCSQGHSGASYYMTENIVYSFSKRGPEFLEYVEKDNLSLEEMTKIRAKKAENDELKKLHG